MSIIRLSLLEDGLHAPDRHGILAHPGPYDPRRGEGARGLGNMGRIAPGTLPGPRHPLRRHLERALAREAASLPDDPGQAPLVVMVHGFQFDPARARFTPPHHPKAGNPHCRIWHFERHSEEVEMRAHSTSWPLGLGLAEGDGGRRGLAVAFAWDSDPGLWATLFRHGLNPYARAYVMAEEAGRHLVAVLVCLAEALPGREIDLFCHSLGSRVVVRALAQIADPEAPLRLRPAFARARAALGRAILLAGAEKVLEAQLMMARMNRTPGPVPMIFNALSRENDVLDKLAENFGPDAPGSKQVIGHNGLERRDRAWLDIQLDDPEVGAWFAARGFRISGDDRSELLAVLDHWIHYTWRGNMALWRALLRERGRWTPAAMKAEGAVFDRVRLNAGRGAVAQP